MGLALTLVPTLGVNGAAITRAATMLILACFSAYAASRHLGLGAVSVANLAIVLGLVVAAAGISALWPDVNLTGRVILLIISLLVLAVAVRDKLGRTQVIYIMNKIRPSR